MYEQNAYSLSWYILFYFHDSYTWRSLFFSPQVYYYYLSPCCLHRGIIRASPLHTLLFLLWLSLWNYMENSTVLQHHFSVPMYSLAKLTQAGGTLSVYIRAKMSRWKVHSKILENPLRKPALNTKNNIENH